MFFFQLQGHRRDLHSFPTRRSSDLLPLMAAEGKKKKTELASEFFSGKTIQKFKITIAPDQLAALKKENRKYVRGTITVGDRKSTRLNSSHSQISYAVFCLKKTNIS